ncbi:ATPase, T2SS/T4P/T4SS family, partial [Acinetobacter baumannii]|nr:ATPase, T2SS/T4P/T4SS family [Acinetobacter baumannii]
DVVFVLRRFPAKVPTFESLNLHNGYVSKLMQQRLSGLIVIAGPFGAGKTTTASALIAARLSKFGGVAITIEDPPEMPLEGKHGEGVCYQTWADRGGFGDATRKMARFAPSIIFLGEVRDAETAAEALRASINGRLVVCTAH